MTVPHGALLLSGITQDSPRDCNFHDLSALEDFVSGAVEGHHGAGDRSRVNCSALGKLKASQNRSIADRQGVVQGLEQQEGGAALAMADLVKQSKT